MPQDRDGINLPKPFSRVAITGIRIAVVEIRVPAMAVQRLQERLQAINPD